MKDNRAFILREDKVEEFLSKPKKNPRIMIKEMSESIAELKEENKKLKSVVEEHCNDFYCGALLGFVIGSVLCIVINFVFDIAEMIK